MLFATLRRATATLLVMTVLALMTVVPAVAEDGAVFNGKVYGSSAADPMSGVVVTLVEPTSETTYSSQPSMDDGTFRVEGAPAGSYRVVAETKRGAFLAGTPVSLAPGKNQPVALTLGQVDTQTSQSTGGSQSQSGLPKWAKWTIVGGIAVIALIAIDNITDDTDDEPDVSPFLLGEGFDE